MNDLSAAASRFRAALNATPDSRFFWQPAESARSAAMLAMSVALALEDLLRILEGIPLPYADGEAWNAASRASEVSVKERHAVEARFDNAVSRFETWLAENEDLDVVVDSGFGEVTRATVVGWAVGNLNNRKSQLDYLQTMYGDLKIY